MSIIFYSNTPANAATGCVWFYLPGSFKKSCPPMSQKIPTPGGCTTPYPSVDAVSGEGQYYECCCEPAVPSQPTTDMPKLKMPELQISIPGLVFAKAEAINCTETNGKKICHIPWIGEYIAAVYKYAIGVVGILAAVVLMIGGIIWIVAGGSATMIGEAKSWIAASLTGLVIALCSYLILYQINPALTIFGPLGIAQVEKTSVESRATSSVCQNYLDPSGTNTVKYDSIKISDKTDYPASCASYNQTFNSYGGISKYLKAIAATESSCNPQAQSSVGSCGIMQLQPSTAQVYDSRATTCQWLKDHPTESINIAAQYINANSSSHGGKLSYILAGYNSGYGAAPNPVTGKKAGLASSADCPGFKAFECCINPGGLAETQDYVYKGIKFYHSDPF